MSAPMKSTKSTNRQNTLLQKSIERVFDNNDLVLELFGSHHTNLARI